MNLVDRFLHYVSFDTQSDELTHMTPSTPGQMIFAQELEKELRKIGMTEVSLDENGYLMATLPSNTTKNIPVIFLTGITDRKKIQEALVMKPQGYLLKPINRKRLLAAIQNTLES